MTINISVPKTTIDAQLKPRITVIGVGGAGGNAVNNMIQSAMEGVDFVVANTDAQALSSSRTDRRIQLGRDTTQGLGAGARPDIGRHAAEEAIEIISRELEGAHMAFITAGMGAGTGTGAAPVIARIAREMGVLTVGVVTKPFHFEGVHRMRMAEAGIEELSAYVDTLIVIPNQNLFRVANEKTTFADAFKMADDVLHGGVRSVTDLMTMPGMINLDFADVRTVMKEMGRAMMGTGEASGDRRALDAAEAAIANPLLEESSMRGAKGVLINITGGNDITLFEVDEAANRIRDEVESDAHIIFGSCFDESLEGKIRVSVVATGIETEAAEQPRPMQAPARTEVRTATRRIPEVRSAAPTARPTVAAPTQPTFGGFGFGCPTLAPATGTMDLEAEEQALLEMAAAVKAEIAHAAPPASMLAPMTEVEAPAPIAAAPAPAPAPVMAPVMALQPQSQAAAVAEAVARAPMAAPARQPSISPFSTMAPGIERPRDTFIPRPPIEPRMEPRAEPRMEYRVEAKVEAKPELPLEPVASAAEQTLAAALPPRQEPNRIRLFDRYRSLTAKPRVEEAPAAPQPQAKVERGLNISVGPQDRPIASHSEDELEIPAFLRRQAN